jgi:predicted HAD superfamily Cof-like phosphohydrolase
MTTDPRQNPTASDMVREFHTAFGLPMETKPVARTPQTENRVSFLREEFNEYLAAVEAGDLVEIADALADMTYVIHGTAHDHGIPLDAVVAEVHRSNMSKLGLDGKPILREDGKVIKGPAYFKPDVASILFPEPEIEDDYDLDAADTYDDVAEL